MDMDMDIDFDIEDPVEAQLRAQAAALNALPSAQADTVTTTEIDTDAMVEDGEVAPSEAVANKIHISGLDTLDAGDVKNFSYDNYDKEVHVVIEWIDDHSANIVYDTDAQAAAALKAFSVTPTEDPLEPRRAQNLLTNPDVELWVRQATATDVKTRGAADRSKWYLHHPEDDPANRSRGRGRGGPRRNGNRSGGYGGYGRRRGVGQDERMHRADRSRSRRSSTAEKGFSVDLYDDIKSDSATMGPPTGPRRDSSYSSEDLITGRNGGRNGSRRSVELISNRRDGRLRDRSASPIRDGDGRYGFSDDQPYRQTARHRTPPPTRQRPDNHAASKALREDLFANKKKPSALQNGNAPIELFPSRGSDLFPDKIKQKQQDLTTAINRQAPRRPQYVADRNGGDLISRSSNQHGRLTDDYDDGASFSIKGAAPKNDFSFRGASSGKARAETNGGGRDLFENRSERSGQRLSRS